MSLFVDVAVPVTAIPPGGVVAIRGDVTLELERVVPTEGATHFLWLVGRPRQQLRAALRAASAVGSLTTLDELEDRLLVRIHWTALETPFLDLLDESDAVLIEARGTADGWNATLRFPDEGALESFYEASERRGLGVELRAINGARIDQRGSEDALTPVQRETLAAAFDAGYFDVPRSITIAELADELDRSQQAVSEALRRAMGNHLRATLQQGETSEGNAEDGAADDRAKAETDAEPGDDG